MKPVINHRSREQRYHLHEKIEESKIRYSAYIYIYIDIFVLSIPTQNPEVPVTLREAITNVFAPNKSPMKRVFHVQAPYLEQSLKSSWRRKNGLAPITLKFSVAKGCWAWSICFGFS